MHTYHIDRDRTLHQGQIIDYKTPFKSDYDKQMSYINALFENGSIGLLGEIYTYPNYNNHTLSKNWITQNIFELVRQKWFPYMPSRFQSFFSLSTKEDVHHWLKFFIHPDDPKPIIWEVDVKEFVTLDATWRDLQNPNADVDSALTFYCAQQYWSGVKYEGESRMENISPLPVNILRQVVI